MLGKLQLGFSLEREEREGRQVEYSREHDAKSQSHSNARVPLVSAYPQPERKEGEKKRKLTLGSETS